MQARVVMPATAPPRGAPHSPRRGCTHPPPRSLDGSGVPHLRTRRQMGEPTTEDDITGVIREVDLDGNGMIDYGEFSRVVSGNA